MFMIALAIGGVIAFALTVIALDYLVRRPVVVTWLVLGMITLEAAIDMTIVSVDIGGFRVAPPDVVYSLVAAAAVLRLLRSPRTSTPQRGLIVLGSVALISLVLGVAGGPIDTAVNEFRVYLGFVGTALYFSAVAPDGAMRAEMARAWRTAGIALAGIVVIRWIALIGGVDLGVFGATYDAAIRVIDGPATLTLASCALITLLPALHNPGARSQLRVGVALLAVAVILNRRTLWFGLAVVFIIVMLRDFNVGRRLVRYAMIGALALAVVAPIAFDDQGPEERTFQTLSDPGNLTWRLEGWASLIDSGPRRVDELAIGLPFGSGYERSVQGTHLSTTTPHNFYLQTYLRTGLLGLAGLLATLGISLSRLWKLTPKNPLLPLTADTLVLLLILQTVWCLAWLPLEDQGIILGLAVAAAGEARFSPIGRSLARRATTV